MEIYNLARCSIYNEIPAQNKKNMTTYHVTELYDIANYGIYDNHICTFSKPSKQGYDDHINQQGNLKAQTSTLKSSKIHLLPRKSKIQFQSQSYIQCPEI